jgi:hypothetical protein
MKSTLLCVCVALGGCASTPVIDQAVAEDSINTVAMTCSSPYPLEQDCSIWSGATKQVVVGGRPIKVAGSADGKIILVMDPNIFANSMKDFFLLNSPTHSKANNISVLVLQEFLASKGVLIKRVRPLRSFGNTDGYVLELETDGYSHLSSMQPTS